jgi:hypothetical protein
MRGVMMHAPGDIRVEDRPDPTIQGPTDAIIRLAASCVCGSDLWPYRGQDDITPPAPMGHEYVGVVEEVGSAVTTVKPGDFVVGSFFASDNTCEICRAGYQSRCPHAELIGSIGTQAELARIPLADGTLVATPGMPEANLVPSLLAASDVLGSVGRPLALRLLAQSETVLEPSRWSAHATNDLDGDKRQGTLERAETALDTEGNQTRMLYLACGISGLAS